MLIGRLRDKSNVACASDDVANTIIGALAIRKFDDKLYWILLKRKRQNRIRSLTKTLPLACILRLLFIWRLII